LPLHRQTVIDPTAAHACSRKFTYAIQLVQLDKVSNFMQSCIDCYRQLSEQACIIGFDDPAASSLGESRMAHKQNKQTGRQNEAKRDQHSVAQRSPSARLLQAVFGTNVWGIVLSALTRFL